MKKLINTTILTIGICVSFLNVSAQQVNTLYFLENAPVRHYLNPSFQPLSNFYFGLPVLGYTQFQFGNNSVTTSDLIYKLNGQTITFMSPEANKLNFINSLKPVTMIGANAEINIFDFGFRHKDAYWSFGLTEKVDVNVGIPRDLLKLALVGTTELENNTFNFSTLGFGSTAYTEAALGYSRILGDKWSLGLKAKVLCGTANVSGKFDNFILNAGIDEWKINGSAIVNTSSAVNLNMGSEIQDINPDFPTYYIEYLAPPAGLGGAFDIGATFKPFEFLTLSAAVTDLGLIRWSRNVTNATATVDYTFDGVGSLSGNDLANFDQNSLIDTLVKNLKNAPIIENSAKAYNTYLSPKLNAGAEFGVLDNRISLGVLSRTIYQREELFEELTAAVNLRPANWFNLAFSYSLTNGRWSNLGAGLGMRVGFINFFATADYIPMNYAYFPTSFINQPTLPVIGDRIPFPYKTDRFNVAFGVNLVFGNKQDKDRDGVTNRKDICPDTPRGVVVDKKGCPVDTDGDGIPDYLDKCPNSPLAAKGFVDSKGCPIDTDGDGVYDFKDKCSNTPVEARGSVDENGCPKDTDNDGIFDYLDKCPGTPAGVQVDSNGCPIDSDGDGVADYLDLCPNTPLAAKGLVDKNGCPLDSDDDGVYDYLDLCANTPIEARGFIDKNGCPLDSDDDGVADYLDKCPNTPVEARGTVDEKGCPRDTDGDGIADYLDNCPKLFGVAANKGCPEVKKEVRTLFQKALQGIQFESGKDVIKKSSNIILDQIAKVLIDNKSYLVEVQGHTDNVGKPELNQLLSEKRANAVRNYLISKGVEEKRITAKGYGDTKPVASNKTTQGKAKNRRVEFIVTFEEVTFE